MPLFKNEYNSKKAKKISKMSLIRYSKRKL